MDTETTSTDPMRAELVGSPSAHRGGHAIYVPVGHHLAPGQRQAARGAVLAALTPILADPAVQKVGQNLKYDLIVLKRAGLAVAGVACDTMVASYLLNPDKQAHNLAAIAAEFLGRSVIPYEEAVGGKGISFAEADLARAAVYSGEDADVAWQAAEVLEPRLEKAGLTPLFRDLEMPLVPLLAKLEMAGVGLDVAGLNELGKELEIKLDELEQSCYRLAGRSSTSTRPASWVTSSSGNWV